MPPSHDTELPVVRWTEVDGIPTVWTEAPPPFSAWLVFRVGRADETLTTGGITHLVEHLAMPGGNLRGLDANASVELLWTVFWAAGPEQAVVEFLRGVSERLHELPLQRLEAERRILRSESAARANGAFERMLAIRYGADHVGLLCYPEYGLFGLTEDALAAWAREWFTRENAVLVLTGPPPEGMSFRLASGERKLPHPPVSVVPLPLYENWGDSGAAMSMTAKRSFAVNHFRHIARDRAMTRLRFELGITYHVGDEYLPLNAEVAHVALIADALEDEGETVARELVETVQRLSQDGPTADELDHEVESTRTWLENAAERPGLLFGSAIDHLLGAQELTPEDILSGARALTPNEVGEAGRAALETALLLLSGELKPPRPGFAPFPPWNDAEAAGARFRMKGSRLRRRGMQTAIVGREAVSLVDGDACATILRPNLAAAVREEDGTVALIQRDGRWLTLYLASWSDAAELERRLEEFVPPELWVRIPSAAESTPVG